MRHRFNLSYDIKYERVAHDTHMPKKKCKDESSSIFIWNMLVERHKSALEIPPSCRI